MDRVDCVVVGAGVIGLAVARRLALAGREVWVLEKEDAIGTETSSRNSEVVHAGIYYPSDSNKARLCVAGRDALYRYCQSRKIPHKRTGKLIVATDPQQLASLGELFRQGTRNGVHDLELLGPEAVGRLESELRCVGAILSPSTGILDSHAFMQALQADAESAGATFVFGCPVIGGQLEPPGAVLRCTEDGAFHLRTQALVIAAGLHATNLATEIAGFPPASIPPLYLAKGSYYELGFRTPFQHLVYPLPEQGGLGVHLTLDLAGRGRFGPDVEWVEHIDYDVDPNRSAAFYQAIRRYWPGLPADSLHPGYAGIRPKLEPKGRQPTDFMLQGPETHGVPGLVNLFGIESPGLTAALAIADEVVRLLG